MNASPTTLNEITSAPFSTPNEVDRERICDLTSSFRFDENQLKHCIARDPRRSWEGTVRVADLCVYLLSFCGDEKERMRIA